MTINGRRKLKNAVILTVCMVWALNLTVIPLIVKGYKPSDLNPLIMAIIAALLYDKNDKEKGEDDGNSGPR